MSIRMPMRAIALTPGSIPYWRNSSRTRHQPHFAETVSKAYRALCKFRIEGVATNLGFLQALLQHPDFQANRIHTGFVEEKIAELAASVPSAHRRLYFARPSLSRPVGAKIDSSDPLAILDLGRSAALQDEQPTQEYCCADVTQL